VRTGLLLTKHSSEEILYLEVKSSRSPIMSHK